VTTLQLENMVENEPDFKRLVRFYAVKAAQSVASEDVGTPNHAQRLETAGMVIRDTDAYVRRFMELVIINPTIASRPDVQAILDNPGDIEFQVNSVYDTVTLSD
jgi:hypothetical protein